MIDQCLIDFYHLIIIWFVSVDVYHLTYKNSDFHTKLAINIESIAKVGNDVFS